MDQIKLLAQHHTAASEITKFYPVKLYRVTPKPRNMTTLWPIWKAPPNFNAQSHLLSDPTPQYVPKRNENPCPRKDVWANVLRSLIHSTQKDGEEMSISESTATQRGCIRTTECYLAIRRNEGLVWIWQGWASNKIVLNERRHRGPHTMIPFIGKI